MPKKKVAKPVENTLVRVFNVPDFDVKMLRTLIGTKYATKQLLTKALKETAEFEKMANLNNTKTTLAAGVEDDKVTVLNPDKKEFNLIIVEKETVLEEANDEHKLPKYEYELLAVVRVPKNRVHSQKFTSAL